MIPIKASNEKLTIICSLTYLYFLVAACLTLLSNLLLLGEQFPVLPPSIPSPLDGTLQLLGCYQSPQSFNSAAVVIPKKLFLGSLTLSKAISCSHGLKSAVSESGCSWNLIPCMFPWIISSNNLLWAFPRVFLYPSERLAVPGVGRENIQCTSNKVSFSRRAFPAGRGQVWPPQTPEASATLLVPTFPFIHLMISPLQMHVLNCFSNF